MAFVSTLHISKLLAILCIFFKSVYSKLLAIECIFTIYFYNKSFKQYENHFRLYKDLHVENCKESKPWSLFFTFLTVLSFLWMFFAYYRLTNQFIEIGDVLHFFWLVLIYCLIRQFIGELGLGLWLIQTNIWRDIVVVV